jgi:5-methylcytosine-specific restriction enzyme subunit McrC
MDHGPSGWAERQKDLNEDHLRQLHTYMMHHPRTLSRTGSVEGLLLYPLIDQPLEIELMIKGQRLRLRTINFALDWPEIRTQLLGLLEVAPLVDRSNQAQELIKAS